MDIELEEIVTQNLRVILDIEKHQDIFIQFGLHYQHSHYISLIEYFDFTTFFRTIWRNSQY